MPEPAMLPSKAQVPPLLAAEAGARPSPVLWRALALLLDTLLASIVAMIILSTVVFPQDYPKAEEILEQQMQAMNAEMQAISADHAPAFTLNADYLDLSETIFKTFFVVFLLYFATSEFATGGSTLGKRVFGLRAAQWGGMERPTWAESLTRNILKSASLVLFWPILLIFNSVAIFFRPSRRALHDYLARTIVTGDAAPPPPPPTEYDED